jgi:CO dehydrogenase/acetyl-CoA synthase beta subunit
MAGKIQLKLKKKEPAGPAPAAAPAAGASPVAAPAFAMPAGGAGGIKLVLKDAKITIDKVVLAK